MTCCVIWRTAFRVSKVGAALGGVQAVASGGISGWLLADPGATSSRASSEPGCSSSASTSSRGSWSRRPTSSMMFESRKSAFNASASMWPTVAPPAPNCRPIVMTGTADIVPPLPTLICPPSPHRGEGRGEGREKRNPCSPPSPHRGEGRGEGREQQNPCKDDWRAQQLAGTSTNATQSVHGPTRPRTPGESELRRGACLVDPASQAFGRAQVPEAARLGHVCCRLRLPPGQIGDRDRWRHPRRGGSPEGCQTD